MFKNGSRLKSPVPGATFPSPVFPSSSGLRTVPSVHLPPLPHPLLPTGPRQTHHLKDEEDEFGFSLVLQSELNYRLTLLCENSPIFFQRKRRARPGPSE